MGRQEKVRLKVKPPTAPGDKPPSSAKKAVGTAAATPATAAAAADKPPPSSRKRERGGGAAEAPSPPAAPPPLPPEVLELQARERELVEEHRNIERQIYELESKYLTTSNPYGNAMKGYANLSIETADRSKRGAVKADDRVFSQSSLTGQLPAMNGTAKDATAVTAAALKKDAKVTATG